MQEAENLGWGVDFLLHHIEKKIKKENFLIFLLFLLKKSKYNLKARVQKPRSGVDFLLHPIEKMI